MISLEKIIEKLKDKSLVEDLHIEFKTSFQGNPLMIAKYLIGFANAEGGYLIYGISEHRGMEIIGIPQPEQAIQYINIVIANFTIGVSYSPQIIKIQDKDILIIAVEKSVSTAYFVRKETSPERQTEYVRQLDGRIVETVVRGKMAYKNVYKYMTLDAFIISLYSGTWRFFEPSKWNDSYEQRFYCANYSLTPTPLAAYTPQLFATCVTRAKESEAAWKVYAGGVGLGAHCVQLELDIVKLREELRQIKGHGIKIVEKLVQYENENYILNLHKRGKAGYSKYFSPFSLDRFLDLLTLKRDAYSYEKELRLFIIPPGINSRNSHKKSQSFDVQINWSKVIKSARVDHNCSPAELAALKQACFHAGINPIIKNAKVFIPNVPAPLHCISKDFTLFDIDAMPGRKRIIIK